MDCKLIRFLFVLCCIVFLLAGQAVAENPELISKSSTGEQADTGAGRPHISGNGRYVAFVSDASNLVDGVAGGTFQVYRHDRKTGATTLVSKNDEGEPGNDTSRNVFVSHTGRYVGFGSEASNLDPIDDNNLQDCFLVDTVLDSIERYHSAKDGAVTSSCAQVFNTRPSLSISRDGRYATFQSGDGIKLVDRGQGTVTTILPDLVLSSFERPLVNADGTVVVFATSEDILEEEGPSPTRQVYVYDIATQEITLASRSPEGDYANGSCERHSVSDDGMRIQFDSGATNLVVNDTNGVHDVFVYDRETNITRRVSLNTDGSEITGAVTTGFGWLSGNGLFSVYSSTGGISDVVSGAPSQFNVFVYDIEAEQTTELGLNTDGEEANGRAIYPVIDSVGHRVTYPSAASDLIADDSNGSFDVFVEKNAHCEDSGDENSNGIIDCLDVSRETRPDSGELANKKKRKATLLMEDFEGDVTYKAKANCRFTKNGQTFRPRRRAQSDDSAVLFRRLKGVCKFRYRVIQDGVRSRLSRRLRSVFGRVNR